MVLNLKMMKRLPRYPIRSCRKKIGPGEAILIQRVTTIKTGNQKGRLSTIQRKSRIRFQKGLPATLEVVSSGGDCGTFSAAEDDGSQCDVPLGNRSAKAIASSGVTESQDIRGLRENTFRPTAGSGLVSILCISRSKTGGRTPAGFESNDPDFGQLRKIRRLEPSC
jgi:hypothetical protein